MPALILAILLLVTGACASTPELDVMLAESPRGAVYLERIPDRSFQAAHPITINRTTMARVLQGILVKDQNTLVQKMMAGISNTNRAFSDDEVAFLAPLLADGLARAAADQQVGFKLNQKGGPTYSEQGGAGLGSSEPPLRLAPKEITSGSLYAYGRSLYVTIEQYRYRPERPDTINMPNRRIPDRTGLADRTILFAPESAKRPDSYRTNLSTDTTLVIDYELVAALPVMTVTPARPAATAPGSQPTPAAQEAPASTGTGTPASEPDPELRSLQDQMRQKDAEMEELRKEMQDIRRQMGEASTGSQPPKSKTKPSSQESR
jgi:hypothetical protein